MGHSSKQMIYEVYGDYIEGFEEDIWQILKYFGKDFAQPKMKHSCGKHSQGM
jgi:integrase